MLFIKNLIKRDKLQQLKKNVDKVISHNGLKKQHSYQKKPTLGSYNFGLVTQLAVSLGIMCHFHTNIKKAGNI